VLAHARVAQVIAMAKSTKPRFNASKALTEMLCGLPYQIRIDYSKAGQAGKVDEVKVPAHLLEVVVKEALRQAWAAGYSARMEQPIPVRFDMGSVRESLDALLKVNPKRMAKILARARA
jgi:hypothetical protein